VNWREAFVCYAARMRERARINRGAEAQALVSGRRYGRNAARAEAFDEVAEDLESIVRDLDHAAERYLRSWVK
jgi:hypothetical protein